MAEPGSRRIEIGLVLQGGGALGAYEWGAVTALLDLIAKARSDGLAVKLRGVTGVSVGAINAACVVGSTSLSDAQRRLSGLWADPTLHAPPFTPPTMARDLAFFGLPGFYVPRADVWNLPAWTSLYDTGPLLRTLRTHVDFGALNASGTAFVVTAVDLRVGRADPLPERGRPPSAQRRRRPDASDPAVTIGPEHVLASASLAPQFPWTEIGGRRYWDGGLVDNTPLGDAIDALSADPATMPVVPRHGGGGGQGGGGGEERRVVHGDHRPSIGAPRSPSRGIAVPKLPLASTCSGPIVTAGSDASGSAPALGGERPAAFPEAGQRARLGDRRASDDERSTAARIAARRSRHASRRVRRSGPFSGRDVQAGRFQRLPPGCRTRAGPKTRGTAPCVGDENGGACSVRSRPTGPSGAAARPRARSKV